MISRISSTLLLVLFVLVATGCPSAPPACTAGTQSCVCREGGACNTGLACASDNKCAPAVAAGVQIADAAARGCEFVLTEAAGTEVVSVVFKNGAKGTWVREPPRVAVTVLAGSDAALNDAVQLGLTGAASNLSLSKASCVGLTGQRLATSVSIR